MTESIYCQTSFPFIVPVPPRPPEPRRRHHRRVRNFRRLRHPIQLLLPFTEPPRPVPPAPPVTAVGQSLTTALRKLKASTYELGVDALLWQEPAPAPVVAGPWEMIELPDTSGFGGQTAESAGR